MAKSSKSTTYLEEFNFILNNETNTISSNELIVYLTNMNGLFKSINHTLNSKYAVGYDQVLIDVIALEKGSFNIKASVKKIVRNDYTKLTAGAVLGAVAAKVLSGDPTPTYVFNNCDNIIITSEAILNNPETRKAASRIATAVVASSDTTSLSIEHLNQDDTLLRIEIDKEKLKTIITDEKDELDKTSNIILGTKLVVVSPVLESEPANWSVKLNDRKISAKMTDDDFLKAQDKENIAFGKGDSIIADVETIITMKSNNTPDVKHYIRKVHEYPRYAQKKKELSLFD